MNYVDGFVIAVPTDRREEYRKFAELAAPIFREVGALQVVECWGDDVPDGKLTSFPMAVKLEPNETVVFAWIVWPSKEVRDEGLKKTMNHPRMAGVEVPFDTKRMIFGGFRVMVEA